MYSFPERDISQNSVSTSYASISEPNNILKLSCHSLCGQGGSWECQWDCSSYLSIREILSLEEASPVSNFVSGGFEENIIPHVYDEQEGDEKEEGLVNLLYEECNQ